jgi:hypothetical protein
VIRIIGRPVRIPAEWAFGSILLHDLVQHSRRKIMHKPTFLAAAFLALAGVAHAQGMDHAAHMAEIAKAQRQAEVSQRGKDVMPFSLPATQHIFTTTATGGVQQVVARNAADAAQVQLVRQHLREIREQFLGGDFSGPAHIHGRDMPGLAELQAARPGQLAIAYRDIEGGAELRYSTQDAALVAALHRWFGAQLSDHGPDAMAGHEHHGRHR